MAVSIMQVARTIGDLSGWSRSNLEMQKIAYIAEMLYLGRTSQPLTSGNFQAWNLGPVHPELYHWAKMYGAKPVEARAFRHVAPLTEGSDEFKAVRDAYEAMKDFEPWEMVDVTHQADGAWAACYKPGRRGIIIEKQKILDEYSKRVVDG